jgi:hypothetical protein
MVAPFGIQRTSDLYVGVVEEVYVNLQTREPFPRRDSTLPARSLIWGLGLLSREPKSKQNPVPLRPALRSC